MKVSSIFLTEHGLRAIWKIIIFLMITGCLLALFISLIFLFPLDTIMNDTRLLIVINSFPVFFSVLVSSWIMMRFIEKKRFSALGFAFTNTVKMEIRQGIYTGFGIILVIFIVLFLTGCISASLSDTGFSLLLVNFILYFLIFFVQSAGEEILFRGYLFQILLGKINKPAAVIIMSLLFSMVHYLNPDSSFFALGNVFLFGVLLSAAYIKTRSLWFPIVIHFSWNFSQSFIFSFPVSGITINPTLLSMSDNGPSLLTGGRFGPEANLVTTVVTLIVIAYITFSKQFSEPESISSEAHEEKTFNEN